MFQLNSAVEWSDDRSFNQKLFSLRLEYKMPKLNEQPSSRHSSTSSSMTSHVQYKTGIQRTLSNDTGLTEVPTPGKLDSFTNNFHILKNFA